MCDVPSTAVFCSESIECFPGTASNFSLKLLVTIPVAPIITGTIVHFRFHIRCISIHKLLYFNFFSTSFCTTFLSQGIAILLLSLSSSSIIFVVFIITGSDVIKQVALCKTKLIQWKALYPVCGNQLEERTFSAGSRPHADGRRRLHCLGSDPNSFRPSSSYSKLLGQ